MRRISGKRNVGGALALGAASLLATATPAQQAGPRARLDVLADDALAFAGAQLRATAAGLSTTLYPKQTSGYSVWTLVQASDWSSGFFPGANWLVYDATGDATHRALAETWTAGLASQQFNTTTHDVGFIIFSSFGNAYRLTGDPAHAAVLVRAAQSLATRFDRDVGALRSWSWGPWSFPVIIDNLMNLELLFWAAQHTGSAEFDAIARAHAETTRLQHVRPDGSTYHLVDFDPVTGAVIERSTWSGVNSQSTWSRGQAWAIHGFTMIYRETGDPLFLDTAERAATYFLDRLPPDGVPYWDFQAPGIPNTERDTSAAAIAASGLLELSTFTLDPVAAQRYVDAAVTVLTSLATPDARGGYLALGNEGVPISPGVLIHGCGGHPSSFSGAGVPDESLIWGDYYFLEALARYRALSPRRAFWPAGGPQSR